MASVEERYNKIVQNVNNKIAQQQSVYERFSNIVNRVNNSISASSLGTTKRQSPLSMTRNTYQNFRQQLPQIKQQLEEKRRQEQQKQQEMKQLNNKIKNLSEEEKNALSQQVQKPNIQLKAYNADNVSKDLGVSKEEAEKLIKKSNSLPSKIRQSYNNSYGKTGFAGVNAMANEIKKTPEVLQKIKETSAESPTLMGLRGSMAGTVDAVTSEIASLFETPEEEKWYEKNIIARQAKTYKRVVDKARQINQNGGNALDVIWGAGSTLATGTVKNAIDTLPINQMSNKIKKSTQEVLGNTLDEYTRKQVQKTMLGLTDSYYQDRAKYQENEAKKSQTQQYIDTVLEGTSRMGGSIATSYVTGNPEMGLIATGLSAKGSATQEALREGATLEQAIDIGNISGLVEMATEKIWSGIKLPGGKSLYGNALGDAVENFVLSKLKTKGAKWLASKGMDIAGEIAEEFISDTLEAVAKQGIYDDNAKLPTAKDYWNTATTTAGTTVLLNLLTGGFLQAPNISNQNTNQQQQISQTENENVLNQNVKGQNKLEQRVSGDELLNTQDFIEDIKNVGANVDENGYVTVYHRTSKENADSIYKNGKMSAKEDGIFFSTSKDGYNNSNYGDSVVELKVPAEMLELDDIFDDEASVKIKLDNKKQQLDVSNYIAKENNKNSITDSLKKISKWALDKSGRLRPFKQQVHDYLKGNINTGDALIIDDGNTVDLSYAEIGREPIVVFQRNADKVLNTKHSNIPTNIVENLDMELNNSVLAMDSISHPNARVIVLNELDSKGNPIIAIVHKGKTVAKVSVNELTSVYDKKEFQNFINRTNNAGGKFYTNNKTTDWLLSVGLQLPENFTQSVVSNNIVPQNNQNVNKNINLSPKVSANNQYKDTTTKVRKHYKSIIESSNTTPEAKAIAKELMGTDTYIPETNKSELERADEKIMNSTPESELDSLMSRATVGEKITPVDIAVGERLIQYYSKIGDGAKLQDAIQATAMAGTTAGQTVQAMSLLNHMTPQGQAVWLQRSVDKMNNKLKKTRGKNAQQFTLTDDMLQKIVSSENKEQLATNLEEVYKELGQQVSKSTMEKIDAWRYFSMLANPRTHIRNIGGNVAMGKVQTGKNKVAGVIEATVAKFNPGMERTHTIVPASKEVRQFAKDDIRNVTDRLGLTEGKLNPQTRLENNMKTFKHDAMNKTIGKMFELNNKALEVEDGWGLKAGYAKALAEYMTANKLKPNTITDAQLAKARNYAVQQAKEATFHQENQLASLVNQLSNRNKFAKFGVDAVLPFKKTPMNIAKTGIEYSPVGLAKSMVLDTVQLRKGNITVNQYIDNISKGLTGTGIALVGYVLAQAGILKASGGDDDKEKYEEGRGKQAFSIQIGDNTYSLDWLAPTAIPLFIGAEISALNRATNETKTSNSSDEDSKYNQLLKSTTNVLDAFTNSMNPMMEMSMLSGLASTLRSYEQGPTQGITAMGTNALKSYVNQFFPTAMGQVAKTMDPYERSTTSTKSGMLPKAVDSTKNQIMAKVPGLRQMLPTKTDVWGNEMKQPENVVQRALENAVLPYTRKEVNNNDVDQELVRLYEERGEKAVLPSSSLSKDLTFSGEKYKMTSEEFAKYKKDYGSKSYSLINDLVNSSDYNRLSDEDKQQALENVYKYAKENDIDYKKDTMFKTAQEMEKSGNVSSYFNYLAKTDGMKEKEKMNVLVKASYDNNDKKLIYTNTIGSDDKLYNDAMKYTGININEYLKYKTQEFTSDKIDDGTENGKSVSGSKKAKVYDFVNKMKITGEQRMLLLGTQYKLTNEERATLATYVKNLKITNKQKLEIYKKLQGFTVYKDGRVTY